MARGRISSEARSRRMSEPIAWRRVVENLDSKTRLLLCAFGRYPHVPSSAPALHHGGGRRQSLLRLIAPLPSGTHAAMRPF